MKVGHPAQAEDPPVPSHLPSPGQVPGPVEVTTDRVVGPWSTVLPCSIGLEVPLAFSYKPHLLHIVSPAPFLLHNGVVSVPQFAQVVGEISADWSGEGYRTISKATKARKDKIP